MVVIPSATPPDCFNDNRLEGPYVKNFSFNNNSYKMETDIFQKGHAWLFSNQHIGTETRFYKKKPNGKFERYTAGILKTGFAGTIFTGGCLTSVPLAKNNQASDDCVTAIHPTHENFGTLKTGPTEPLGFGNIASWTSNGLQLWFN